MEEGVQVVCIAAFHACRSCGWSCCWNARPCCIASSSAQAQNKARPCKCRKPEASWLRASCLPNPGRSSRASRLSTAICHFRCYVCETIRGNANAIGFRVPEPLT